MANDLPVEMPKGKIKRAGNRSDQILARLLEKFEEDINPSEAGLATFNMNETIASGPMNSGVVNMPDDA